jgi:membrane protease YdiL (CAAX protease family)
MDKTISKTGIILRITLAVILFSLFIKFDSLMQFADLLVDRGWSLLQILVVITGIRLILAGLAVVFVMPLILGEKNIKESLARYLLTDSKVLLSGMLAFVLFCALAAVLSLAFGIFKGDLAAAFAFPDLKSDPDVIGWGYFLSALVPGIWEELAFRGWIQSSLLKKFRPWISILLSALFFSLFHFSNLIHQDLTQVIFGVIMAFFFGIGWGWLVYKSGSVVPAIISHYLVDSMGQIFLNVNDTNPILTSQFFLSLTLLYPVLTILLANFMYPKKEKIQQG